MTPSRLILPLKGVTVVEASILVAGPAMGALLRELGADVIKIEQPESGDPSRTVSPWGFVNYNVGKKSLALNLKSDAGREILYRLVKERKVDVFIENFGAHVSDRLGFSYKTLSKLNPALIYCSMKGFSQKSADYERPSFDAVAQAMSGIMSLTGEPNGEPVRIGNPATDLGGAAYGAIQVLGALLERGKKSSRRGRFIEVSLLDMSVYWNAYWLTYYGMTGRSPQGLGSGHPGYSPHRVFKTADGKWIFIATLSDQQWKKLAFILGLKLGAEFDSMNYRLENRGEVERSVQQAVSKLTCDELLDRLKLDVPSAKVRSIKEVYDDRELRDFGTLAEITDPSSGKTVRVVSSPLDFKSGKKAKVPQLGRDTPRILKSLRYSAKEIRDFARLGVTS